MLETPSVVGPINVASGKPVEVREIVRTIASILGKEELVAWGAMVAVCERAAEVLVGEASVEVLDLRSLKPLDEEALLASVGRTGRCVVVQEAPRTCGFASEVAALLAERAILELQGPVLRVTGYDVPYPYWQLEDWYMPSVERVVDAARRVLAF